MNFRRLSIAALFLTTSGSLIFAQVRQDSIKKEKNLEGVTIRGTTKKGAESNIITLQKKSVEVIERVGSVQLEKQGVGDVSVAVTKATGAQKQEGTGQVFIRGLGDRNNSTTMNGLPIPSNDPAYKNVDLSIIKTDMIDFVGLEKVYNPKMWGDMSGANVDIVSKVYTGKPYFKISLGSSINLNNTKHKNFYLQDGPDYFGFKQINKPKNAKVLNYGYVFPTSWRNQQVNNPHNSSLGIDFGRSFNIGEQGKLSVFGYGSFDNDYILRDALIRNVDADGVESKSYNSRQYDYATNTTGLLNLNYRINPNHNVKYTTNYIHTTEQSLANYQGFIRDTNEDRDNETAMVRRAEYNTNDLFINQLAGEHKVTEPLKLFWNVGYNRLESKNPDRQQNISIYNHTTGLYNFVASNTGANHRYFDNLIENDYVGDIHADYQLSDNAKITLGYNGRYKDSKFKATQYNFRVLAPQGNYYLDPNNLDNFFNLNNYNAGLFSIVTFNGDIRTNPTTALIPQFYNSEILNNAGYANVEYKFNDKLTAQLGVRYDNLTQKMDYYTSILQGKVNKDYSKILPAFNLKYSINDQQNLRFAASKTYTTPLLIEVAPFERESVDELSYGNPDVNPSDNYNADLKWEWFPNKSEVLSVTVFGKYIKDPIARITANTSSTSVSFANVGDFGTVFGAEMELRKDLFKFERSKIYTFLNATYLNTKQELSNEKVNNNNAIVKSDFIKDSDKMTGASDLLANVNLGLEQKWGVNNLMDFVVSYSYISDNVYALGYQRKGNLIDKAIHSLDAIMKLKWDNGLGLSFSGKNLINPRYQRIQANENRDEIVRDFKKGITVGMGVSYEF